MSGTELIPVRFFTGMFLSLFWYAWEIFNFSLEFIYIIKIIFKYRPTSDILILKTEQQPSVKSIAFPASNNMFWFNLVHSPSADEVPQFALFAIKIPNSFTHFPLFCFLTVCPLMSRPETKIPTNCCVSVLCLIGAKFNLLLLSHQWFSLEAAFIYYSTSWFWQQSWHNVP